jgi:hypothetical protein
MSSKKSLWNLLQNMTPSQRRLFVCDCVEHVLHIYEEVYPGEGAVREVVKLSRRFADGSITYQELAAAVSELNAVPDRFEAAASVAAAARFTTWRPEPEWDRKHGDWDGMDQTWEVVLAAQQAQQRKQKTKEAEDKECEWQL